MLIKIYQADAFTNKLFGGNPAAVCLLDGWLSDPLMQSIAAENNLAETAFVVKSGSGYEIRWFTPAVEVDLCGHATLASAHVIFNHTGYSDNEIHFHSHRSGALKVSKESDLLTLDFPADELAQVNTPAEIIDGLGIVPVATFKGKTDYMAVLSSQAEVAAIRPVFSVLETLPCRGIIVTAPGDVVDMVSRFFAPRSGINEDPVTGSAHTSLVPYWAGVLNKTSLSALQISSRVGTLYCRYEGSRVKISGKAITYLTGEIEVPA